MPIRSGPDIRDRNCAHTSLRGGFTLVELLVVIAILVLLAGLIASGASRLHTQQKIRSTQQAMSNILLAIDNFSKENPLRLTYDRREDATFGPYPPYMLANALANSGNGNSLSGLFDSVQTEWNNNFSTNYTLTYRLGRDLGDTSGNLSPTGRTAWTDLAQTAADLIHDDNRALYAYLAAFSPSSLSLVPERNRARLSTRDEYLDRRGKLGQPNTQDAARTDVLGFVDAWGVPLDYALYVKVEWRTRRNPNTGAVEAGFQVVDRVPVIRSHGVDREKYDVWVASNPNNPSARSTKVLDPARQILTSDLPKPYARLASTDITAQPYQRGILDVSAGNGQVRAAGWLKLAAGAGGVGAFQDDAKYRPN